MTRNFRRLLAGALTALLVLAGCQLKTLPGGLPGPGVPQDGISQTIPLIEGSVVDALGHPVEGATVRAYVAPYRVEGLSSAPQPSVQATTDSKGGFLLQSPPLGCVTVEAQGRGQKAMCLGIAVAQGAKVELGTLSLQPTGRLAGRVTAPQGTVLLGTDVFIPGTDYLAKTAADGTYVLQDVPAGACQVAALRPNFQPRVLDSIAVRSGETTQVPDLELSLDAPVLTSLNPESGGPGTVVTLRGTNFGASKQTSFQVTFNDTLAVTTRRVSDTEIQATVPTGATSGGVVVRSNGIASSAQAFQVISRLSLLPSGVGLSPGEPYAFALQALNDRGDPISDPFVTWALRDPSLGTVSAQGLFTGSALGVTELEVCSGVLTAGAWVGVSPFRADTPYGNGQPFSSGDGGLAREAALNLPYAVTGDEAGNLYVGEGATTVVRRIGLDGRITRFAGTGARDGSGDGGAALSAGLGDYDRLWIAPDQRMWIADSLHDVIRFIPLDDRDGPTYKAGWIYRAAGTGTAGYDGSGLAATQSRLRDPGGLCTGPEGLYVADAGNHRVRCLTPDGRLLDLLGTGLPGYVSVPVDAGSASLRSPNDVACDPQGNCLISCTDQVVFWCRTAGTYFGRPMQAGKIYPLLTIDVSRAFSGDGPLERVVLTHRGPRGFYFDPQGGCWFTEQRVVRRITPQGRVETVAGKAVEAASNRSFGYDGEGINALECSFGNAGGLWGSGMDIWITDANYSRIRRLSLSAP